MSNTSRKRKERGADTLTLLVALKKPRLELPAEEKQKQDEAKLYDDEPTPPEYDMDAIFAEMDNDTGPTDSKESKVAKQSSNPGNPNVSSKPTSVTSPKSATKSDEPDKPKKPRIRRRRRIVADEPPPEARPGPKATSPPINTAKNSATFFDFKGQAGQSQLKQNPRPSHKKS